MGSYYKPYYGMYRDPKVRGFRGVPQKKNGPTVGVWRGGLIRVFWGFGFWGLVWGLGFGDGFGV